MKKLYLFTISCFLTSAVAFAGGACTPAVSNGSCATATTLSGISLGSPACLTNQSTCGGSTSTASCGSTHVDCAWYKFQATSTSMFVQIPFNSSDGCITSSSVFTSGATQSCTLTQLDCESGGALDDFWSYTTLTVGHWYYIQVCYPANGGGCGSGGNDGSFNFDICVGEPDPPCDQCATPCGTATGYPTAPATSTVVADCQTSPFVPELQPSSTNTFCYSFQATATSVDFNVIITSNCGSTGNVTGLSWSLYNATCGGTIQTGTLSSLTFTGLTVGNDYVFCYTFTVPSTCTHSQHCPYFVGATVLPVKLLNFNANYNAKNAQVELDWKTVTEINNDYFTIEKSVDGENFEVVGIVDGAGNTSSIKSYQAIDEKPIIGTSYYRLKQTDFDGQFEYSNLVPVKIEGTITNPTVYPNPVTNDGILEFTASAASSTTITIYDVSGRIAYSNQLQTNKGFNHLILPTSALSNGMYFIHLNNGVESTNLKFIKE